MPDTSVITERIGVLFQTIDVDLPGGFIFSPTYLQAGLIVFLLFLLVLTLGQLRHRFNQWTFKGAMPGIGFGFAIAIILEGIFIVGGKTLLTEILGWKNAPKPISNVLDTSRSQLVNVLGVSDPIDSAYANMNVNPETVVTLYQSLTDKQAQSVKGIICSEVVK